MTRHFFHAFIPSFFGSFFSRGFPILLALTVLAGASGCQLPGFIPAPAAPGVTAGPTATPAQLPPLPETQITFRVEAPPNTPEGTAVYLSLLDEVTGLALNAQNFPMEVEDAPSSAGGRVYSLRLPFTIGSILRYRYERQAGDSRVAEHLGDGAPVRYRLYHVTGPGVVTDLVSRWTDTPYTFPSGRITGQVMNIPGGQPLANLLVTAGGEQTFTTSDGSFLLEGLPPGTHNLVVYALDGAYRTFQQGARVAAGATTPAPIHLEAAPLVNLEFVVRLPAGTPPVVPVRLAGSLYQLGNTFASLSGGSNTLADRMPVLSVRPDGRYTLTLALPSGADLRYKYTLGDGFWNAEHTASGDIRLRQVVVPEANTLIEDEVETWSTPNRGAITFDLHVPADTPPEDSVSIQFNPLFGWMEPVPMWHLGGDRWAYVLYSPLNLPGSLSYRYCRNGLCGQADDVETPGQYGAGRPVNLGAEAQTRLDTVTAWAGLGIATQGTVPTVPVTGREPGFVQGIQFSPTYHPIWQSRLPASVQAVSELNANTLIFAPTWTYREPPPGSSATVPVLEPLAGQDPLWPDLLAGVSSAHAAGLAAWLYPQPRFSAPAQEWWQNAARDFPWWVGWFDHYSTFLHHHADLAARSGAEALVLGGDWLAPALPGGGLADGSPSGVPADAETRWRELIANLRARYSGRIYWAMPTTGLQNPPPFMDAIDGIYLLWPTTVEDRSDPASALDTIVAPAVQAFGKPVILAVSYSSEIDLNTQSSLYESLLEAVNKRPWISGAISAGYYPPAALQDNSASIHGKPAETLLRYWFAGFGQGGAGAKP